MAKKRTTSLFQKTSYRPTRYFVTYMGPNGIITRTFGTRYEAVNFANRKVTAGCQITSNR